VLQGPYDPETLPSQLIQPQNGGLLFLLDTAAAARLPRPTPMAQERWRSQDDSRRDVGGTKVDLALYSFEHGQLVHVRDERFPAHEFNGLEEIVRRFLRESSNPEITAACFGVPDRCAVDASGSPIFRGCWTAGSFPRVSTLRTFPDQRS